MTDARLRRPAADLLIFAKEPTPGRVKTRLARALGTAAALRAYEAMLECVIARWSGFAELACVLAVTPDAWREAAAHRWPGLDVVSQGDGDLGRRLARVTHARWQKARRPMILIGADSPDLPESLLREAARVARGGRVALCATADGGYCLLAIPRPVPKLFAGIAWGSARVAEQTRRAAGRAGVPLVELPAFCDVDTIDDLRALWRRTNASGDPHLRRLAEAIGPLLHGPDSAAGE